MGYSFKSKSWPASTGLPAHRSTPTLLSLLIIALDRCFERLFMAHPISAMPPGDGSPAGLHKGWVVTWWTPAKWICSVLWMYCPIFPIVFFKHYYCSAAVNSSSSGRMQGHKARRSWHAGSMRKVCEQVGVFVQVCTNISLSKAENIPVLLLQAHQHPATTAASALPPLQY